MRYAIVSSIEKSPQISAPAARRLVVNLFGEWFTWLDRGDVFVTTCVPPQPSIDSDRSTRAVSLLYRQLDRTLIPLSAGDSSIDNFRARCTSIIPRPAPRSPCGGLFTASSYLSIRDGANIDASQVVLFVERNSRSRISSQPHYYLHIRQHKTTYTPLLRIEGVQKVHSEIPHGIIIAEFVASSCHAFLTCLSDHDFRHLRTSARRHPSFCHSERCCDGLLAHDHGVGARCEAARLCEKAGSQ